MCQTCLTRNYDDSSHTPFLTGLGPNTLCLARFCLWPAGRLMVLTLCFFLYLKGKASHDRQVGKTWNKAVPETGIVMLDYQYYLYCYKI